MRCISAAYAVMRCLRVHVSVCLSCSWVASKRIKISSNFFHQRVAKPSFSMPNGMAIFRWEPPNGGVECRCGRQKTRFWTNIAAYTAYRSYESQSVKNKAATNVGKRRAEHSRRRPSPFAQDDYELFVTGSTLYAGDGGQSPARTQPLGHNSVFCCRRTS